MSRTSIEWTDVSWNPIKGCSRISPGCKHCYAERHAGRFCNGPVTAGPFHLYAERKTDGAHWTGKVALNKKTLREPLSWRKPRRAFISMSDPFHENLPDAERDQIFAVWYLHLHSRPTPSTLQILTKRSTFMMGYMNNPETPRRIEKALWKIVGDAPYALSSPLPWPPPNVHLGVSVESEDYAYRIHQLQLTAAAKRFVSYEPALGPIEWDQFRLDRIDQVIIGGESGPGARPFDIEWARQTIARCKTTGVAVFCKQLGAKPYQSRDTKGDHHPWLLVHRKGGDMDEWPEDLRVREFPGDRP
jgi:protein gp37